MRQVARDVTLFEDLLIVERAAVSSVMDGIVVERQLIRVVNEKLHCHR